MFLHFFLSLVVLLCAKTLWMRWKYDLHKIPSPPAVPLLGHAHLFFGGKGEKELSYARAYWWKRLGWPRVMRLNLTGRTVLNVKDMDFAKSKLLANKAYLPRHPLSSTFNMVGGDRSAKSLSTEFITSPLVNTLRRCYFSAFHSKSLKANMPKVRKVIDQFMEIIEEKKKKGPLDIQPLCVSLTLDVIGQVAFDVNLGGLDGSRNLFDLLMAVGYIAVGQIVSPLKAMYCRFFSRSSMAKKRSETIHLLTAEWDKLTEDVLNRGDPPKGEQPLWHMQRTLVDPETGQKLSFKDLRAELATSVVAGMDTTGHQLAWILALLGSHSSVTENILQQMKENGLYGPNARNLAFEDLTDLTYLTAVIKEGMRVCGVVHNAFPRVTMKDMTVLGYRVPKGTLISLAGNRWMHSEDDWEDPAAFKPERWLTGEDMSKKHYLGFSYGPRDCVGQRLAMLEIRLVVIFLIQRYNFELTVPFDELTRKARNGLVIEAMNGIWLHFHPRTT